MTTPLKRGRGRPAAGRKLLRLSLLPAELDRLDRLRGSKPRGTYVGECLMKQPLSPFSAFTQIQRRQ